MTTEEETRARTVMLRETTRALARLYQREWRIFLLTDAMTFDMDDGTQVGRFEAMSTERPGEPKASAIATWANAVLRMIGPENIAEGEREDFTRIFQSEFLAMLRSRQPTPEDSFTSED